MSINMKGVSAGKMKRMMSKKSHSWWWDSHISPKNSKWLAENLQEMDACVKEMLKLIEEEGDSFAKKAEMYYQKRPELVAHVEDFYRMYRALAERYDNVTGELRKNLQSENKSPHSRNGSGSDFGSEPPTPEPKPKPKAPESNHRAAGFDVFLGSGGSSDISKKGSENSSSNSSSDSDSDSDDGDRVSDDLHQRIIELENELHVAKEKLEKSEKISMLENELFVANEKIASLQQRLKEHDKCEELAKNCTEMTLKISLLENEVLIANEKLMVSEAEVSNLQQKLEDKILTSEAVTSELTAQITGLENELNFDKTLVSKLEARVAELENELNGYKCEIEELKIAISKSNETVHQYKTQIEDASDSFSSEKSHLETKITRLEEVINGLREETETLSKEKLGKCTERDKLIAELNSSLNTLSEKISILLSEKEGLNEKIDVLTSDIKIRDDRFIKMNEHLHELHLEHVKLMKKIEKLEGREKELEMEVEKQRMVILDGAEGKREAIRQLCSTLEHYRDRYEHLRQILSRSSLAVMAV